MRALPVVNTKHRLNTVKKWFKEEICVVAGYDAQNGKVHTVQYLKIISIFIQENRGKIDGITLPVGVPQEVTWKRYDRFRNGPNDIIVVGLKDWNTGAGEC